MDNFCVFPAANNQLSLLQMVLLSFYKTSEVNELYPRYRYVKARSICYNSTNVLPIYEICLYIQNWFAFFLSESVLQILEGFSAFLSLLSDICLLMKNEYFKLEFISKRWFYCVACMTWPRISQYTIFNRLAINFHRKRTWYNDIRWPKGDLDRQQTSYIT